MEEANVCSAQLLRQETTLSIVDCQRSSTSNNVKDSKVLEICDIKKRNKVCEFNGPIVDASHATWVEAHIEERLPEISP